MNNPPVTSGDAADCTPCIAVTSGEPAGIGPELCLTLARAASERQARLVVLGDRSLLQQRAEALGYPIAWRDFDPINPAVTIDVINLPTPEVYPLEVYHIPLAKPAAAGVLDPANASYVLAMLDAAVQGWRQGLFQAIVTAPVHKGLINQAGIPFRGHTEYLAEQTQTDHPVMLLVGGGLRVALATTHIPLSAVAAELSTAGLIKTLQVLAQGLTQYFHLPQPVIAVCGLNPHAGDQGYLGREEIEMIAPAIKTARGLGIQVQGPFAADTLFVPERARQFDAILAMYHDQGLAPLKYASFGEGVNVTLGLPFLRTSVDHGTALDLAGTGQASPNSLLAALDLAVQWVRRSFAT